jgi:hypothetical protein
MTTTEKIKKLMNNVNEIRCLFLDKIPKWLKDRKTYDKIRWGFEEGNGRDFYEGQQITTHFGAWCGTYGDSSTYKSISLDGDVFKDHFLKYLNKNKEQIMLAIADSIEAEAKLLKADAQKELTDQLVKLDQI